MAACEESQAEAIFPRDDGWTPTGRSPSREAIKKEHACQR